MGLLQCFLRRALVPGEPPGDRTRKEVLAPLYCVLGTVAGVWFLALLPSTLEDEGKAKVWGNVINRISLLTLSLMLLPAGIYVLVTRRIPAALCEYPVLGAAVCVVLLDLGELLWADQSVISLNVIALDVLLLCDCKDSSTVFVVVMSAVWIAVRSVLEWENVAGVPCFDGPARFSFRYIVEVLAVFFFSVIVLVVDFRITRGFAKSLNTQKAMVEASIRATELAAVSLSEYETDAAKQLLEGPDGEKLPPLLREAMFQLVDNLALYRPYLPQSCFKRGDADEDTSADDVAVSEATSAVRTHTPRSSFSSMVESVRNSGLQTPRLAAVRGIHHADARTRSVTLLAVNTTSSLRTVQSTSAARGFIHSEVECFVGEVGMERGVVDFASGDHLFANFNASQMCTTHKVSASRAAWNLVEADAVEGRKRTGCVCAGTALCGDFGSFEMRRFMVIGGTVNSLQSLERVAALLGALLVDEPVGGDADVGVNFFTLLVERLCYAKRGAKPFLVWQLSARRAGGVEAAEWMYQLERQVPNPHESWNKLLLEWLHFGRPLPEAALESPPFRTSAALTRPREQSHLMEAAVVGGSVAFSPCHPGSPTTMTL